MNTSIHSKHHTEEQHSTTDEIKQKTRTTSTLLAQAADQEPIPRSTKKKKQKKHSKQIKHRSRVKSSHYLYLHLLL
jgi:hypothetical protein